MFRCAKCGETKPRDAFYGKTERPTHWCKVCGWAYQKAWRKANPDKVRATNKRWSLHSKDRVRAYNAVNRYNITLAEYDALMVDARCAICDQREHLTIDHCHTTGRVRGTLCRRCNVALGIFKDDPDVLRKAIDHLGRG